MKKVAESFIEAFIAENSSAGNGPEPYGEDLSGDYRY